MKIKKYSVIALAIALALSFTACMQDDTGNDNARNNGFNAMDDTNRNTALPNDMTGDGLQGQNRTGTGMSGNQNTTNPGTGTDDAGNLNTGMRRPGRLTTSLGNLGNEGSDELARQISDLPEVDDASVVINDNRAIVGIKLMNKQRQTEISSALRSRIEDMVRDVNDNIDEVSITADGEIYDRIEDLSGNMLNDGNNNDTDFFERVGQQFDELIDAITPNMNR